MFAVIFLSSDFNGANVTVYGPFATQAQAYAFIGQQANPSQYTLAQVLTAPPVTPPATVQPQSFAAGQVVVALNVSTFSGVQSLYLYGPFANVGAAQSYIAGRAFPGGCQPVTVTAPPS